MEFDRIAVIGEREIALGFKLVGVSDVFMETGENATRRFAEMLSDKEYGLVIVSESIRKALSKTMLKTAETTLRPLVVFIPAPGTGEGEESVEALAKRILGVNIQSVK